MKKIIITIFLINILTLGVFAYNMVKIKKNQTDILIFKEVFKKDDQRIDYLTIRNKIDQDLDVKQVEQLIKNLLINKTKILKLDVTINGEIIKVKIKGMLPKEIKEKLKGPFYLLNSVNVELETKFKTTNDQIQMDIIDLKINGFSIPQRYYQKVETEFIIYLKKLGFEVINIKDDHLEIKGNLDKSIWHNL